MRKIPVMAVLVMSALLCAMLALAQEAPPQRPAAQTPPAATAQSAQTSATAGARFRSQVAAIAAGSDTQARGAAIMRRLDELGLRYCIEPFARGERRGRNIVAELPAPNAPRRLMLGAHYDRVAVGQGAVDNASGSAAVLELLAALKERPLQNYAVTAIFFDLEEVGLIGSAEYIAANRERLPHVYVNFDVFGYGDTLWVLSRDESAPSHAAMRRAATERNFPLEIGPNYPPSDHLSFLRAQVETISVSLIPRDEIRAILGIYQQRGGRSNQPPAQGQGTQPTPPEVPRLMSIIHRDADTPDKIDGDAAARAIPIVEHALRLLDAAPSPASSPAPQASPQPSPARATP